MTQPFRPDPFLQKDDPDYYTAIYSSKIEKFNDLFDTLRGKKELYFTPSERSLLTHELLSRAHSRGDAYADEDDDDDENSMEKPVMKKSSISLFFIERRSSSLS